MEDAHVILLVLEELSNDAEDENRVLESVCHLETVVSSVRALSLLATNVDII
jgi:hypothetical protein